MPRRKYHRWFDGRQDCKLEEAHSVCACQAKLPETAAAKVGKQRRSAHFRAAGWRFYDRPSDPGAGLQKVLLDETGGIVLPTSRISVKFQPKTPAARIQRVFSNMGLTIVRKQRLVPHYYEVEAAPSVDIFPLVTKLAKHRDCMFATPVMLESFKQRTLDPQYASQWQWPKVGADQAWLITRGRIAGPPQTARTVRIAVLDWGFDLVHQDLAGAVTRLGHFRELGGGHVSFSTSPAGIPADDHGTFCVGTAAARGDNNLFGVGMAPLAELHLIACLSGGFGSQTSLARAIRYAVNPATEDPTALPGAGADVISCSIFPANVFNMSSELDAALQYAFQNGRGGRGTLFFYAAPHGGLVSADAIASHPRVITVGSSNQFDLSENSASGIGLEYLAPGISVRNILSGNGFDTRSGTSFAAPLAAGVAALVLSVAPTSTATQIRDRLRATCDRRPGVPFNSQGFHSEFGYGRINADRAVRDDRNP